MTNKHSLSWLVIRTIALAYSAFFVCHTACAASQNLPDTIDRVWSSVVMLNITKKADPPPAEQGAANTQNQPTETVFYASGIVFSTGGYIATMSGPLENALSVTITTPDGLNYKASIVAKDQRTSIAILRAGDITSIKPADFGDSSKVRTGQSIFAMSSPHGLMNTVYEGIIAGVNRYIDGSNILYFQIDKGHAPGSAGGAVFDDSGKLIGMLRRFETATGALSMAIPSNDVLKIANQLKTQGTVVRGWLGVKIQNVTEEIKQAQALPTLNGAHITEVTPGGPAEQAGIQPDSVVLTIEKRAVRDSRDLAAIVSDYAPGTVLGIGIKHQGKSRTVRTTLGRFPDAQPTATAAASSPSDSNEKTRLDRFGLTLVSTSDGSEGALIHEITPNSEAATKGLRTGDIILEVGGNSVTKPGDVRIHVDAAAGTGRKMIGMRIQSGAEVRSVDLKM